MKFKISVHPVKIILKYRILQTALKNVSLPSHTQFSTMKCRTVFVQVIKVYNVLYIFMISTPFGNDVYLKQFSKFIFDAPKIGMYQSTYYIVHVQ